MRSKLPKVSPEDRYRIAMALRGANGTIEYCPQRDRFCVAGVGWVSMWTLQCVKLGLCGKIPDELPPSEYGG